MVDDQFDKDRENKGDHIVDDEREELVVLPHIHLMRRDPREPHDQPPPSVKTHRGDDACDATDQIAQQFRQVYLFVIPSVDKVLG